MFPGTVIYVAGSDAVSKFITHEESPLGAVAACAVFGAILYFLVRYARGLLKSGENKNKKIL
jgi:hypothetical protein